MTTKTRTKPKKKTKAIVPKPAKVPEKEPDIAYTLTDPIFGEFPVLASANAWWIERAKVENLILAFKYDATYEEASVYAGIQLHQLKYFLVQHPEFSTVIAACRTVPTMKSRSAVIQQIEKGDGNLAFKYLERKRPEEFGHKPPIVGVQINMQQIVNNDREKYQ